MSEMNVPFSIEPLDMANEYSELSVKTSYEYTSDTKNKYNGEKEIININTTMSYPVTEDGLAQAAEFIKNEVDAGHKIEANALIKSDSPMKKQVYLPVNKEKLDKFISDKADKLAERAIDINEALASGILSPAEKAEFESELKRLDSINGHIDDTDKLSTLADRLEQFMFERGEYDYSSDEHIRWLADANIPDDAGEREARECVMNHIKESLEDPDALQHLINYLNDEIAVIDEEDENLHVADILKTELEAVQSDYYTQVFSEMIEVMDFSLEKSYSKEDNAAEYSLKDEQNANLGAIENDRFDNAAAMIDRLDTYLNDYYFNDLEEEAEADGILNRETDAPETAKEWLSFMNEHTEWKDAHKHEYEVMNMIANHADAVNVDKAWENFHTPQEIELCNKEIEKSIQEHDAWKNYGDVNFAEYGGTLVRPTQHSDEYEFFHLVVDDEGNKFAFSGTIDDLHDYADEKCVIDMAQEFDISVEELLFYEPTRVAAELVERYGHGVVEFSPSNNVGTGRYSMDYNDFKVTDRELAAFMEAVNVPYEYIPKIEPLCLSDYIYDAKEPFLLDEKESSEYKIFKNDNLCVELYIALDDEAFVDAIERSDVLAKLHDDTPEIKSLRDIDLSDISVYLITDGSEEETHLMVSHCALDRMCEVKLSSNERDGFVTEAENVLEDTVENWVKKELKEIETTKEHKNKTDTERD